MDPRDGYMTVEKAVMKCEETSTVEKYRVMAMFEIARQLGRLADQVEKLVKKTGDSDR